MNTPQSERIVIESPMSFAGATKRLLMAADVKNGWLKLVLMTAVICFLPIAYCAIFMWYAVFGIFLIPFRVVRRSQRKAKKEELRYRELLAAQKNK